MAGTVFVSRCGERKECSSSVPLLIPDEAFMRPSPEEHFHNSGEQQEQSVVTTWVHFLDVSPAEGTHLRTVEDWAEWPMGTFGAKGRWRGRDGAAKAAKTVPHLSSRAAEERGALAKT